jgi:hypothetical protein
MRPIGKWQARIGTPRDSDLTQAFPPLAPTAYDMLSATNPGEELTSIFMPRAAAPRRTRRAILRLVTLLARRNRTSLSQPKNHICGRDPGGAGNVRSLAPFCMPERSALRCADRQSGRSLPLIHGKRFDASLSPSWRSATAPGDPRLFRNQMRRRR